MKMKQMTSERIEQILTSKRANGRSAIGLLSVIQDQLGYLPDAAIDRVAKETGEDADALRERVTFFPAFVVAKTAPIRLRLCTGPSCRTRGALAIRDAILAHLNMNKNDRLSKDGRFSLELTGCAFACSKGPVLYIDDVAHYGVTPEKATELITSFHTPR